MRVVPRLNDQTGRKGISGTVEIDVTDRLRALIHKNLSKQEKPVVELEYQVTDDIRVKGIKDQHGEIGGELEMRWKF